MAEWNRFIRQSGLTGVAKIDGLVKSPKNVIPAQAGIYKCPKTLDSAIKSRNDIHEKSIFYEIIKFVLVLFFVQVFSMTICNHIQADEGLESILKGVLERYNGLNGLSVDYRREIITKSMSMLGDDVESDLAEGVFLFMPPHYLKVQQESPQKEFIYADNENMYWYIPEEKVAYKYPVNTLAKELEILSSLFTGMMNIEEDFEVIPDPQEDSQTFNLKLIPRVTWEELDHVRVSIDREKYHLLTVEIVNLIGSITRFRLDEFKPRDDLTKEIFIFQVPEGVRVIEEE